MTLTEFESFIASFNKHPGEYSREEYYQIGKAHKQLEKRDRSWNTLATTVGWKGSGESYRSFINRANMSVNEAAELAEEQTTLPDYEESLRRLYMEKQKIRDERSRYNRSLRYEARLEDLRDTMIEVAKNQKGLPLISYSSKPAENLNSSAILVLSDWHIGQESDNYYNKYNIEIAKKRIKTIVNKAIKYCHDQHVKVLHVLNLGDLIEGFINLDARIAQTKDVCEQVMIASEYLAEALCELQEAAPTITYRSVVDNHARFHQDKKQAIPKENFNRLTDWYIRERLKDSKIKFMDDNISPNLGRFTLENGMKVAFAHGHQPKDKKEHTLQTLVGIFKEWTDVVIYGHLHNPAEHVYQNMRLFINGSLCGVNEYAFNLGLFTEPSQKLLIFNNKDFLNLDLGAE